MQENFQERKYIIDSVMNSYSHANQESQDFFRVLQGYENESANIFLICNDQYSIQLAIKQKELEDFLRVANTESYNIYSTVNTFYGIQRNTNSIFNINALYVDIDCHTTQVNSYMIEELIHILESDYFNIKVPYPTLIVNSGRGLQLYWKIESAPKQALQYWNWVENKIIDVFDDLKTYTSFNIDKQVKDASRVLRVPGTYNLKAHSKAHIIEMRPENVYTLDEIKEGYIYYKEFKKFDSSKIRTYKDNYLLNGFTKQSYALAITDDLLKLVRLRKGQMEGKREFILWLYRMNLLTVYNYQEANNKVYELNNLFDVSLSKNEVDRATVFRKGYKYKTKTLIDRLSITQEEQSKMKLLIDSKEKNKRRRNRRRGEDGLTKKQRERNKIKKQVYKMKKEGMTIKQISNKLNLSKRSVQYYINKKE